MTKQHSPGAENVAPLPGRRILRLLRLSGLSMANYTADCQATIRLFATDDVPEEPDVRSSYVPDLEILSLSLKKHSGFTNGFIFVDPQRADAWSRNRVKLSWPNWRFPVARLKLLIRVASCLQKILIFGPVLTMLILVRGSTDCACSF